MKSFLLFAAFACSCNFLFSQSADSTQLSDNEIIAIAHQRGIADADIPGFLRKWKGENFSSYSSQRTSQPAAPLFLMNNGFETGDFTGWSGEIGDNTMSSNGPLQSIQPGIFSTSVNAAGTDINARHTILTSAGGNDTCGGFPVVPVGLGNFTVRLGGLTANYQGETVYQVFTVAPSETYIKLNYAVALNDGGHLSGESPYFRYDVLDSVGNPIATRYDEMYANPPGYLPSTSIAST